jgi:hypothetical protein
MRDLLTTIWHTPSLLVAAATLTLSANLYSYRFQGEALYTFNLVLTIILTAVFITLCAREWSRRPREWSPATARHVLLTSELTAIAFLLIHHHVASGSVNYDGVGSVLTFCGIGVILLLAVTRAPAAAASATLMAFAIAMVLVYVLRTPFEQLGGDQLALIDVGAARLLDGKLAYEDFRVPGDVVAYSARPLPYVPLLWLPYVPFRWLGLDLRYLSIVSLIVVAGLLTRLAHRTAGSAPVLLTAIIVGVFVAPMTLYLAGQIQTPVYWAILAGLAYAIATDKDPVIVGLLCGAAVGARETFLLAMPLMAGYYARRGWRALWRWGLVCGLTIAAAFGPFLLVDARATWSALSYNVVFNVNDAFVNRSVQLMHVGFGGRMLQFGVMTWGVLVQAAMVIAAGLHVFRRGDSPRAFLFTVGAVYFAFLLLNSVSFEYYYMEPLLLMAFSFVCDDGTAGPATARQARAMAT